MGISKIDNIDEAFLIESTDLKSFDNLLNDLPGETTYSVETADKINRKYESMDTILSHENSSKNSIQKITIEKYSISPNLRLLISFNKNHGIWYSFSTKQENLIPKINRFIDCAEGTKAWYSGLSKFHFASNSILFAGLLLVIISILGSYGLILKSSEWLNSLTKMDVNLIIFYLLTLFFLAGLIIDKLKNRIFPKGFFAIGQGEKRYKNLILFQGATLTITMAIISILYSILF